MDNSVTNKLCPLFLNQLIQLILFCISKVCYTKICYIEGYCYISVYSIFQLEEQSCAFHELAQVFTINFKEHKLVNLVIIKSIFMFKLHFYK